mgnify:CR=1 FL=1
MEIRKISPADLSAVIALMKEFAEYEDLSDYCTANEERLNLAMFGKDAFVEGLVAASEDTPAGYAIFYPFFASFRAERGLYLEDIYVQPDHRRGGTVDAVHRQERPGSCHRVEWSRFLGSIRDAGIRAGVSSQDVVLHRSEGLRSGSRHCL